MLQPAAATRHSGGNSCSSGSNRMFVTQEKLLNEQLSVVSRFADGCRSEFLPLERLDERRNSSVSSLWT